MKPRPNRPIILAASTLVLCAYPSAAQAENYEAGSDIVRASLAVNTTLSGDSNAYSANLHAEGKFKLFDLITAKVAEGDLRATIDNTSKGTLTGVVKVAGKAIGRIDESFTATRTVRSPSVVAGIACPRLRFSIGPVRLGVRFFAHASAWAQATAAIVLNKNPSLPPVAKLTAGPNAEAVAGGEVDLSLVIVKGGVSGQVRVVKHALNAELIADFAQSKGTARVVWNRWAPLGSIVGYVKVRFIIWNRTYRKTLVSWGGAQTDVKLASKSFSLGYKPIIKLPVPPSAPGVAPAL